MLLLRPGEYRSRWERRAAQPALGEVDVAAVARVLAESGGVGRAEAGPAGRNGTDAAALDRMVRDALDGTMLDEDVLRLFETAFALDGRDTSRLRDLLRGTDSVRVITGEAQALSDEYLRSGSPQH